MSLLFTLTYIVWFLSEILLNRLLHSKSTDKQNADKNSLSLIWVTIVVTISVAVFIAAKFHVSISLHASIQYTGLVLIYVGIILRLFAVASLGRFFTVDVTIRQGHKLKKDGIYKYVRHPSYFASLLSFIGFGLCLNNWISLLLITIAIVAAFTFRIKIEERILTEQFGEEYIDYKKSTRGLIPFIY